MESQAIYRKSEKGAEAIATRGHGVGGKQRMLLILVDGKKNVEELTRLAAGMGESAQLLQQLAAGGFIEAVPGGGGAGPTANQAVPAGGAGLSKLKPLATRFLIELMGPQADDLCLRIEAAKDMPEFVEAVRRAYSVVRDAKGQAAADRFGADIEAQMPGA
ncbi:MAG: hypothetical protein Q8R72_08300 [Hylemonella sp.]|nr:hypothetical protein [Hylemonella sp.]